MQGEVRVVNILPHRSYELRFGRIHPKFPTCKFLVRATRVIRDYTDYPLRGVRDSTADHCCHKTVNRVSAASFAARRATDGHSVRTNWSSNFVLARNCSNSRLYIQGGGVDDKHWHLTYVGHVQLAYYVKEELDLSDRRLSFLLLFE